jgi:hypothetical protein
MKPVIEYNAATARGEQPPDVLEITAEEQEIDRVLADSFPASDPPSWTLGVAPAEETMASRDKHHA